MKKNDDIIDLGEGFAFLSKIKTAVVPITDTTRILADPDVMWKTISVKDVPIQYIPWGNNDNIPSQIINNVYKNPSLATGLEFNVMLGYGDGIMPVRKTLENNQLKLIPVLDNKEINTFLDDNDINGYFLEQLTDLKFIYNVFPEVILSRAKDPAKRKVVEINHKEATFSRLQRMDPNGIIQNHLYCSKFGSTLAIKPGDVTITPMLDYKNPILDLKRKLGLSPRLNGKYISENQYRYIVPMYLPTPGHFYYQQPYWWSIFESGWFDYACAIPKFKKALLQNQMTIKYMVYIMPEYWAELYTAEGITDAKKKKARMDLEYQNIQDFLSGEDNTGKAVISKITYRDGKENPYIKIVPIENAFKGGEYIEDSQEASNIISFALGVHPAVIGADNKSGSINGTEARELFIIKQALMKPIRDRLLRPLYLVKAINGWPDDIHFTIPNLELTTLDANTGAKKVISQPALN
jgi:hypothetical protein